MTNTEIAARNELLHRINALLTWDTSGRLADRAMGLMKQNRVGAGELNAYRMSGTRRPVLRSDAY